MKTILQTVCAIVIMLCLTTLAHAQPEIKGTFTVKRNANNDFEITATLTNAGDTDVTNAQITSILFSVKKKGFATPITQTPINLGNIAAKKSVVTTIVVPQTAGVKGDVAAPILTGTYDPVKVGQFEYGGFCTNQAITLP